MKKSIIAIAVFFFTASFAFANNEDNTNTLAVNSFAKDFATATHATWEQQANYSKVTFELNGAVLNAFYSKSGSLIAVSRNILSEKLPLQLQMELKKNYAGYWISDLFELSTDDESAYYVKLENAGKAVVLKSNSYNEWSVYNKQKKEK